MHRLCPTSLSRRSRSFLNASSTPRLSSSTLPVPPPAATTPSPAATPSPPGSRAYPSRHYLRRLAQKGGLGRVRVHDLRHTWATLALSRGIPLEVVSERLGHANPNITLGVYRHLLEEERRGYVIDLEDLLKGPEIKPQA